jgi:hypothetical protein
LDRQLEQQRKRRRVIQRDMARLAKKFDDIKDKCVPFIVRRPWR